MDEQGEVKPSDGRPERWALPIDAAKVLAADDMRNYAIFALDADGRIASWNEGARRMKGYRSEEIIGRHFSIFYPKEQIDSGYPAWELEQARTNGFLIDRGWRLRKDGTRFWAHVVITVQRDPDGRLTGFIKVTRDETEAGARQIRTKQRFTDLFELAPVGIALIGRSDTVLHANGALCDLLGYRRRDLETMTGTDLVHPRDKVGKLIPSPSALAAVSAGQPVPHRVLARADGEPVLCDLHCAASVQDDGSRSWLVVFHDITARVRRAELLHHQATHDEMTGLLNRAGAKDLLSRLLRQDADGPTGRIAVLFCDLDNFKRVNDELDHEAGDELLVRVARRLADELPPTCTAARLYGDEFLVLCSDVSSCGGPDALAAEVAGLFQTAMPVRERLVRVSASIGSAVAGSTSSTAEDLIRSADRAMFEAKLRGAGQVHTAVGHVATRPVSDQLVLEEHLRQAIRHDRLNLHYQPVVADDGSVILAEALLRWTPPDHGPLSPDVVLAVAEQGGLLEDLDRCVLRTALRAAAGWQGPNTREIGIAVNLSGLHPDLPGFATEVRSAIEDSGVSPERVVLEMVETVLVDLTAKPLKTMTELIDTGIRFAMDDFGTGYSSLARLKDLPTQIVKLDQRFVSGLGADPVDLGIVRAVTELARLMGRQCIAEGVENTTQHQLLQGLGVNTYQGYLFSTPLSAADFSTFLSTSPRPTTAL